jgi:nucleoid-associated protein YgaU
MVEKMPGEDELIKGQQELAAGLKHIFEVFNNYLTTTMIQIEPGDTLWKLAETHLGDGQRWRELYFLNLDRLTIAQDAHHAIMSPNLIYAGNNLRVFAF